MHNSADSALGHVEVTRASTASDGSQLDAESTRPALSADGTLVAFVASLVNPTTGFLGPSQAYVKDLLTGGLSLVSTTASGETANGTVFSIAISDDGKKVAFHTGATNLVAGDSNNSTDVFVKDLVTGAIIRASVDASGNQVGGNSMFPSFSRDGTMLVFTNNGTDFAPGAGTVAGSAQVYVKNLTTGAVTLASTNDAGQAGSGSSSNASFSPDGTQVVFNSFAANLVANDTNGRIDVFTRNLVTGTTTLVSQTASGELGNGLSAAGTFSPDGTRIAFQSSATNFVLNDNASNDIFIKTVATGEIIRVSTSSTGEPGDNGSTAPLFAGTGRIVFASQATNLVAGTAGYSPNIYVKDLATGETTRVSTNLIGEEANHPDGVSFAAVFFAVSADGRHIAFNSAADNLTKDDNFRYDIFLTNKGLEPNVIFGTPFDETLAGTSANEVFVGYFGADKFVGGGGNDTVSYIDDGAPVFVNLTLGQGYTNTSFGDTYSAIANVVGSSASDFIIGKATPNKLEGRAGNDVLLGALGGDWMIGGAGVDWASYEENAGSVFVNLVLGKGFNNAAEGDVLEGIENLVGGLFDDFFIGDDNANRLNGAMGADTLVGNGGADVFIFAHAPGATSAFGKPNVDLILDFATGIDKIELAASAFPGLPAGSLAASAFRAGNAAHDGDDRIVYDAASGKLFFDPDGTGGQAALHFATLGETSHPAAIAATDFIVV